MSTENTKSATVYGKTICGYCTAAKALLTKHNYTIDYINLDDDLARKEFYEKTTKELGGSIMSVPQIWIGQKYIGGYAALVEFFKSENSVDFNSEF
jgi:glutaredoxin 1